MNTDFEVRSLDTICNNASTIDAPWYYNIKYLFIGVIFGIILVKTEVISWFRIQEMFRLQSFHMYGVIGSAVVVGMAGVWLIKKFKLKTFAGEPVDFSKKKFNRGQVYGGLLFGFGWALTGACPGPMFALVGDGFAVFLVVILAAVTGTWVYGLLRNKLPH